MKYTIPHTCQIANLSELYEKYFGELNTGTFVDVGAHDGISFSNVRGLAEAGWSGICFEPLPELFEKLLTLYVENDNVLAFDYCIGDYDGEIDLYLGENPTIDLETVEKQPWGSSYDKNKSIKRICKRLDTALALYLSPKFEVLSIDVEGAELQVLRGFSIEYWLPKMIIIETHDGNPDSRKSFHAQAINDYFASKPYVRIQCDGLNTIFVQEQVYALHT